MSAKRGCDTELDLSIGLSRDSTQHYRQEDNRDLLKQKQITIFYNGQISNCEMSELQARAIISMAKQVMEVKKKGCPSQPIIREEPPSPQSSSSSSSSSSQHRPDQHLSSKLSLKLSLQRFLERRHSRIMDSSPYNRRLI